MRDSQSLTKPSRAAVRRPGLALATALLIAAMAGQVAADSPSTLGNAYKARMAGDAVAPAPEPSPERLAQAQELAERWGIQITAIRLTAHNHMIDFRYRVLDPSKAAALFVRQTKPQLVDSKSGRVLVVPDTAKIGPLRNSYAPQKDKVYWMFFGNAGDLVQAGDEVTVVIGDFQAEHLIVE
jgi:hypothetical protein